MLFNWISQWWSKVRKGVFPNIGIWFLNFTVYLLWNVHIFQALKSLVSILLISINMKVYQLKKLEEMKQQLRYICKDALFLVAEMLGRSIFVFHSKEDFWFWFFWGKMLLLATNIKRIFFGACTEPKLLPDVSKVTILQWWDWSWSKELHNTAKLLTGRKKKILPKSWK